MNRFLVRPPECGADNFRVFRFHANRIGRELQVGERSGFDFDSQAFDWQPHVFKIVFRAANLKVVEENREGNLRRLIVERIPEGEA